MKIEAISESAFILHCEDKNQFDALTALLEGTISVINRGNRDMMLFKMKEKAKERTRLAQEEIDREGRRVYKSYCRLRKKYNHAEAVAHIKKIYRMDDVGANLHVQVGRKLFREERDRGIIAELAKGKPMREVGKLFGISASTVAKIDKEYREGLTEKGPDDE